MATGAERARAYRLRHARDEGHELEPEDQEWLAGYEGAQALQATERISHVEERSLATATGGAAEALATGAAAREEGRRLDTLLERGIGALEKAAALYHQMAADLLARSAAQDAAHVTLLGAVREHFLARVEAEGNAIEAAASAAEGSGIEEMAAQMLPALLRHKRLPPKPSPK